MLHRRRWFVLVLVATVLFAALAACDDEGDEATEGAATQEEAEELVQELAAVPEAGEIAAPDELEENKEAGPRPQTPPESTDVEIDPAILASQLGAWIQPEVGPYTLNGVTVAQEAIDQGAMEALTLDYTIVIDGQPWAFHHAMELHSTPHVAEAKRDERVVFYQNMNFGWYVAQTFDLYNDAGEQLGSGTLLNNDAHPIGLQAVVWNNGDRLLVAAGPRGVEFYNASRF